MINSVIFNKKVGLLVVALACAVPFLQGMEEEIDPKILAESVRAEEERKRSVETIEQQDTQSLRTLHPLLAMYDANIGLDMTPNVALEDCDGYCKTNFMNNNAEFSAVRLLSGLTINQLPGLYQMYPGLLEKYGANYGTMCGLYGLYNANALTLGGGIAELNNRSTFDEFVVHARSIQMPVAKDGYYEPQELATIANHLSINCCIGSLEGGFIDVTTMAGVDMRSFVQRIKRGTVLHGSALLHVAGNHWITLFLTRGTLTVVDSMMVARSYDATVRRFVEEYWDDQQQVSATKKLLYFGGLLLTGALSFWLGIQLHS